ncbi:MAG: copper-translocating P-type ATPase [Candidatus Wildermuthbacteria bacterium RIFCSPHIGHO2_02_FULL_47_17]|uniref:P-type Cu(+) transporter n=1 Tax=Candidatus Wildermuthbacteria bacterium RIFCSPHIGHO2_02_FULL_47_17 TaxID=1802452 RepID=A0A1G2R3T3_9BACT|nr:MAG: copper-translocating P-type ATPase [Candidatus Wildermuthbacteria bacterium RIFCSPHIGHO2_02_FULL_47_17]
MAKDIVCGMYVNEAKTPFQLEQEGQKYFFCSSNCLETFLKPQKESQSLLRFAIFSLGLGTLTAIFEYIYKISWLGLPNYIWLFFLATPVQFIGGWRFYRGTVDAVKARQANMDSLIAIGTSAAWIYSTIYAFQGIFWPQILPKVTMGGPEVYFTESGLIIGFILIGKYFEHLVKGRASKAIRKLVELQPKLAIVIRDGAEVQIPAEEVKVGDIFIVKPGEKIAVDGIIAEGFSAIDESMITGESMPVGKKIGEEVMGATINKSGLLKIRATKVGADTALSQIVKMVQEAIASRAPMQRMADVVSAYFVPAVILIAIFAFAAWYFIWGMEFSLAFTILISVLIIACPCALGIATPSAIMIGAGRGAQNGILIKSGEYLEKARKITAIIFDKTGTLTKGEPSVTDIVSFSGPEREVLKLAAIAERGSEHPLGQAIIKKAKETGIIIEEGQSYETVSGKGIKVLHQDKAILVGNRVFMADHDMATESLEGQIQKLENEGKTVTLAAYDREIIGLIAIADTLKEFSREAVETLKKMGKEVWMITGDNERTAKAIASQIGIDFVMAQVLPQEKAQKVKELQAQGKIVAACGDGINDAPMLAQSDVGIAVGAGTDVAKETGGIVLIKNDLRDVVTAIDLSGKTVNKMKQNLFWAFFYNISLIPLAAGLLYLPFGILLNPIYAAIAMATSSISVVTNAMLLNFYKPKI